MLRFVLINKNEPEKVLFTIAEGVGVTEKKFGYMLSTSVKRLGKKEDVTMPIFIKDFEANKKNYSWKEEVK